ncbi:hypothetical protein F1559_004226 [Cyanidiococcus yangmingshanensis]|uniref:Uncharacterized protein n=1 Tax=Cyanidiococcus yangmingshanensis TaxID=2690220 RepID=A0A7J7IND6_9RHOD|nr:hypothetical protein F1559_004226 [Cyanidiococcus yangmingshanensis]
MERGKRFYVPYILLVTCALVLFTILSRSMFQPEFEKSCGWEFVSYVPSSLERTWLVHADDWGEEPCQHVAQFSELVASWLEFIKNPKIRSKEYIVPAAMSRFTYRNVCDPREKIVVPIEPLFGPLRNPEICKGVDFVDRSYIYIDWQLPAAFARQRSHQPRKSHYFDLGASTWTSGAGAASQNWIVHEYERRGIFFDGIWAWESTVYEPNQVWDQIPERYVPAYHWFNIPAEADEHSRWNPLNILARVASKEDFVVLKIDIDNSTVENRFLSQIRSNKTLQSLIDEMYFEPHFKMNPLQQFWGSQTIPFKDVITLLSDLRTAGIRIHGWI